jgi:hypothetical protein
MRNLALTAVAGVVVMVIGLAPSASGAGVVLAAQTAGSCQLGTGPPGGTSGPGGVELDVVGHGRIWCSYAVLDAHLDITTPPVVYPEYGYNGQPVANSFVSDAVYLAHLLDLAGIASGQVTEVQVSRASGGPVDLNSADVNIPSPDGVVPLIWFDGTETLFQRPPKSYNDDNEADSVLAPAGTALEMTVYTGPVLTVTATASPDTGALATQPVRFVATASGATPSEGPLTYMWDFGDGASATGAVVTHAFSESGTYAVTATVTGSPAGSSTGTAAGVAPTLDVVVGTAPARSTSPPAGSNPTGSSTGFGESGRGVSGGSSGIGSSSSSGGTTEGAGAPGTSKPSASLGSTIPATVVPTTTTTPSTRAASRTPTSDQHAAASAQYQLISGQLLGSAVPSGDRGATVTELPVASIDEVDGTHRSWLSDSGWIAATLTAVVVLVAGGLSEGRSRRRARRLV